MKVVHVPTDNLARTNNAYVSSFDNTYCRLNRGSKEFFFRVMRNNNILPGEIGLNSLSRRDLEVTDSESRIRVESLNHSDEDIRAKSVDVIIEIDRVLTTVKCSWFMESSLIESFTHELMGQILDPSRLYAFWIQEHLFAVKIKLLSPQPYGFLGSVVGIASLTRKVTIKKDNINFFRDFSVNDLGIGGLDKEIDYIFRRVFITRLYSRETLEQLGIDHIRGMMLYGPPGTGKTLIARRLSEMLNCTSLKIVNGPDLLDKFVGESEKNLRELFVEAEEDQGTGLHIIIFDEIDSLCRSRGSGSVGGTGAGDNIVNQLLTKMDGFKMLNNILIIGMTNRIDLIDSALLRPGRFEVKIKIGLPDFDGRKKILGIHTKKMSESQLASDLNYDVISKATVNFTGAEIAGVVRNATTHALARDVDKEQMKSRGTDIVVTMDDFLDAVKETKPMFARSIQLSPELVSLAETIPVDPAQFKVRPNLYFISGQDSEQRGQLLATSLDYPNVVVINNYDLVSLDGYRKSDRIKNAVAESLVAERSIVIFNRVEEIIDYFEFNGHFNVNVAGTVKTLISHQFEAEVVFVLVARTNADQIKEILSLD